MLAFHIVSGVEQDTARLLAVASSPAGLLQVVFQRARNVRMHDQADIGLVDAHAEGIGRGDHAQRAANKCLLGFLLAFGRQSRVVGRSGQSFIAQEGGHFLDLLAGGAVDDRTACCIGRQLLVDQAGHPGEFFRRRGFDHVEVEVLAFRATVEDPQRDAKALAEMRHDVGHHLGLGCGGQALC